MPNTISAGDTAWLLMSSALVMLMTPALGFFYGGLVRRKNVLATIMHSFFILALISVQWDLWGYTLAFGPDHGGLICGLDWLALTGRGQVPGPYATTGPSEASLALAQRSSGSDGSASTPAARSPRAVSRRTRSS